MKVLLELQYTGEQYHGWQVQKNAPSIQQTLQECAVGVLSDSCTVTGCSRTDAGVHARQFFCTLESETLNDFPLDRLPMALNCRLPGDIAAKSAKQVDRAFHPRYSALAKEYEYLLYNGKIKDPFLKDRVWMLPGKRIDHLKMQEEAEKLKGKNDFTSFCAAGGSVVDKVRTVYYADVERKEDIIVLRICADGFLYNMVRIIAGTLYDCATGARGDCRAILEGKCRALAGRTAPAAGLYLNRVFYDSAEFENYRNMR